MKCPDCKKVLPDVATACRCGWLKGGNSKVDYIECAHDGCGQGARVRLKTPTGMANLCMTHYSEHFKRKADKTFTELGLGRWPDESRIDHRKRVFDYIKFMAKVKRFEDASHDGEVQAL